MMINNMAEERGEFEIVVSVKAKSEILAALQVRWRKRQSVQS